MKTVIRIEEENHGFIGLVKDETDIIPFLIDKEWLSKTHTISVLDREKEWRRIPLTSLFGEDWDEILSNMPLAALSRIFDGGFYFSIEEVYGIEFY